MAKQQAINAVAVKLSQALQATYINFADRLLQPDRVPEENRGPQRFLFPTGTLAADLWMPKDNIHLVCMSEDRSAIFWSIVSEALELEDLKSPPEDSTLQLDIGGEIQENIYLHHCFTPANFSLVVVEGYGFPLYTAASLPRHSRAQEETSMSSYITDAERQERLKKRAQNLQHHEAMGRHLGMIYDAELLTSSRDGSIRAKGRWELFRQTYLQTLQWATVSGLIGEALGFLSSVTVLWMAYEAINQAPEVSENEDAHGLKEFFEYWAGKFSKPHMLITAPSGVNVASHVTPACAAIIRDAIRRMQDNLASSCLDKLVPITPTEGFSRFSGNYPVFIEVQIECWSNQQSRKFWDEEVPTLLQKIQNIIPESGPISSARLWPVPLNASSGLSTYVIGVMGHENSETKFDKDELAQSISKKVDRSLTYNRSEALISLEACHETEIEALHTSAISPSVAAPTASLPEESTGAHKRFRTASSALSRLRWDPTHAGVEYEVGYLDRFEGLKWIALENWGKQTEDEDFVPEHRIRQIKVKNGVVVWNREKRLDLT